MGVQTIGALRGQRRAPYRETVTLLAGALDLSPDDRVQLEAAGLRRGAGAGHIVDGRDPFRERCSAL
jgi:hypothetical protein